VKDISVHDMRPDQSITPLYAPPTDLTPGEVGLLYDQTFEDREITATILDLAMRGFIAIRKVPRSHAFGSYTVYEFELLREDAGVLDLKQHEQAVLNGLFGVVGSARMDKIRAEMTNQAARERIARYYEGTEDVSLIGTRVCIDELRPYFYQYVGRAYTAAHSQLQYAGYFRDGSPLIGWLVVLLGTALIAGAILQSGYAEMFIIVAWLAGIGCLIVGGGLVAGAASFVRRDTLGDKGKRYLEGFIMYLKTAEAEGIKLYQTYLPYAVALGLEGEWSGKFSSAYRQPGAWLTGSTDGVSADLQVSVAVALRHAKL
jgi:hypothetical protein